MSKKIPLVIYFSPSCYRWLQGESGRVGKSMSAIVDNLVGESSPVSHRNQKVSEAELLEAIAQCGEGASHGEISRALGGRIGRGAVRVRMMKINVKVEESFNE